MMLKNKVWSSDNGIWSIVNCGKNGYPDKNSTQINIRQKKDVMLTEIFQAYVKEINGEKCLLMTDNSKTRRIPKYVKQKVLEIVE